MQPKYRGNGTPERTGSHSFSHPVPGRRGHPRPAETDTGFDNYPPGVPGRLLCLHAALPGGTFLTAQLLRPRWFRHLPVTFGALSERRVPDDLFRSWIHPLRHNRKVRRDLTKYLRSVPKRTQLLAWADQQRTFPGPVLIIWARHDKLMPPTHAERLADHFQHAQLVWIDDSRTLIPIDQPEALIDHLRAFLAPHTWPRRGESSAHRYTVRPNERSDRASKRELRPHSRSDQE